MIYELSLPPCSIGEESYAAGSRQALTNDPTFCVDPIGTLYSVSAIELITCILDGTTNFVHGFPHVCISLGLIYQKQPVLGVIYNPFLDLLYTAIKGQGSHLTRRMLGSANNGVLETIKLPIGGKPKYLGSLSKALIGSLHLSLATFRRLEVVFGIRHRMGFRQVPAHCRSKGRVFQETRWKSSGRSQARSDGTLSTIPRECRAQLWPSRPGGIGYLLVCLASSTSILDDDSCSCPPGRLVVGMLANGISRNRRETYVHLGLGIFVQVQSSLKRPGASSLVHLHHLLTMS